MLNNKITFIGGGNMAEGIIRGLITNKVFAPENITVFDILSERKKYLNNTYGIVEAEDASIAVKGTDIVLIAVRPQDIIKVAQNIKNDLSESTIIISICAGIKMEKLGNIFGNHHKFVRIMPNTMIDVHHGYSAANINDQVQAADKKIIETLLSALGQTMFIDEDLFNAFTAYGCAGPAYIMYFLAALIDSGVESGFSRKDAISIALENLIASAPTVQKTGKHPCQLTDIMT
ncbi:MAG TPA: NAD(P)-binding domain-containing protein, partial [Clostridium sp.]